MQFIKKGFKIYNRYLYVHISEFLAIKKAPLLQDIESSGVFIMQRND